MTTTDLLKRLEDRPFKPFRLHLSDGSRLDVTNAGMFVVGEDSAVLPSVWATDDEGRRYAKHWRTIALAHVVQFGDIDETVEGKRRKRK
ncbi:MAG: hypothetical protein JO353_08260 [Phycisphaerae bacterium]|nr:hypothetical protein [Phycisphaerae bacterium]